MRIFFAGPLTELANKEKTKAFYKKLGQVAQANGFESYWAFLHGTDPELNPNVSPQEVYKKDIEELAKSDLMVSYVGEPTTGTGIEVEYAKEHHIPVFLLYEKGKQITRMLRGSPAIKGEIVFSDESDALTQFDKLLKNLTPSV